jgi:U5 small nuclear ribonucleoprotein component
MEDENLYDEFGNYIGPEIDEEDKVRIILTKKMEINQEPEDESELEAVNVSAVPNTNQHQIVLHEDKVYYPELSEVYKGAETLVMEEDN